MRALRPMTNEEREFAAQEHQIVIDFLRCKRLPMDDFYDIVIFGYLSAVQQYFRNPPAGAGSVFTRSSLSQFYGGERAIA